MTLPEEIPVVPEPSRSRLNPRQLQDYIEHRETFLEWLFVFGKAPEKAEGRSLLEGSSEEYCVPNRPIYAVGVARRELYDQSHTLTRGYIRSVSCRGR